MDSPPCWRSVITQNPFSGSRARLPIRRRPTGVRVRLTRSACVLVTLARWRLRVRRRQRRDRLEDRADRHRLHEMRVEAGDGGPALVLALAPSGHRDDARAMTSRARADRCGDLIAIEPGQADVEEDD